MAVITTSVYCPECCQTQTCFGGSNFGFGTGTDQSGPCVDFLTMTTTKAPVTGLYQCTGGADDQATISWPNGSFFSPSYYEPYYGPCYGGQNFSFQAFMEKNQTISCEAGSWGALIGCSMECCLIEAP